MKKILSLLFIAVLTLAGCSDDSSGELSGKITVGIFGNPTEIATYTEISDNFTAETGVEVELKQYTDFTTEIQAELIGGTAPDVFYVDSYVYPFFSEQGVLEPVDESMYDISEYNQNLLNAFTTDGQLYALPKDYSTLAIYYNKKFVNAEDLPTAYEDLRPYLETLQKSLPEGVAPMTVNIDLARQLYLAESSGATVIDPETGLANFNQKEVVDGLSTEYELAKDKLMVSPADYGFGWNGEIFGSEKTALMLEGNWVKGELDNNYSDVDYGVVENFTTNGKKGSMLFTVGWGVNAASENKLAAQTFVQYLSNAENVEKASTQNGTLPARDDVAETMGLVSDEIYGPHVASAEYARVWQAGNSLSTINTEYMNYMLSVVKGERTLEEALAEVDKQANAIIEANQ
ncbi:extracellular solute-binding protein [Mollicutes bacterium LVI A0039]|nr:extracellular solute-binding protein [Mollicutes bacterium LVI A0039]